jgi:adenylate kinase
VAKNRIVLFGPPASGKGTQRELIEENFKIPGCSTGAMLRKEIEGDTKLGREAQEFLALGKLVPDELMIAVLKDWLGEPGEGFVLDGFPRTVAQAEALDALLEGRGQSRDAAIYLDVSEEVLEDRTSKRVQCGECERIYRLGDSVPGIESGCPACGGALCRRDDDTSERLRLRLAEYREKTEPLIDYFRSAGKFVRINGDQTAEIVFKEIADAIGR